MASATGSRKARRLGRAHDSRSRTRTDRGRDFAANPAPMAARPASLRLAVSDRPLFVVADAPDRGSEPRRPCRPDDRLPVAEPVPGRHYRGPGAEPDDPGGHHRGGRRRFGRGRHRRDHDRPGQASAACARPDGRALPERRGGDPVLHQSGAGRAGPSSARHADSYQGAHLRQRRPTAPRTRDPSPRMASWCGPICPIPPSGAAFSTGSPALSATFLQPLRRPDRRIRGSSTE